MLLQIGNLNSVFLVSFIVKVIVVAQSTNGCIEIRILLEALNGV